MKPKKILVMCNADPNASPRPYRMIKYLLHNNTVSIAALSPIKGMNLEFFSVAFPNKTYLTKIKNIFYSKLRIFDKLIWSDDMLKLSDILGRQYFDLIISHDLSLLPLALKIKNNAKILFDAREYYPKHFEDRFLWKFIQKNNNEYLCKKFMNKCDKIITVSKGIAIEYKKHYGVTCDVFMSLPFLHNINPSPTNNKKIKIIHHGNASPSRKIESMIHLMDYVDERFILDLMLMPSNPAYLNFLKKEANKRQNVRVINPVSLEKIVTYSNQYDIGLFLAKPVSFNLQHTLPNKFFEFIQARLMVAIGPSVEMKSIVEQYNCGIIAENFQPATLAKKLNALYRDKIIYYKKQSHKAANELNDHQNNKRIQLIIDNCIN